jgi:DNA ligase-1
LPTQETTVQTPLTTCSATFINPHIPVAVVPILRAGLGLLEGAQGVLPLASIYHFGLVRNEETLEPTCYLNNLPEKFAPFTRVLITEPMLAKNYDDYKDELKYPIYSQPKLDGIRCVVKKDGMWSRNGKSIVSAPHVLVALKPFFDKFPDAILDGELYADKFANDFNAICSLVKKTKPTPEDLVESAKNIQYWVYDWIVQKTFSDRNSDITTYLTNNNVVRRVPTHFVDTITHLNELYEKYINEDYEGQMVRTDGPYENKRSKHLLKRKEFKDSEFKILDIVEGVGNKSGMAGHMVFKNHKDIEFHSNIKGDRNYLRELLTNKNKLIGKSATVKYFNLTPGDELPRFPYVVNIDRENYE